MRRLLFTILMIALLAPSVRAEKNKTASTPTPILVREPDPLPRPLQAERVMGHSQEICFVRRRKHSLGKRGIDVSHYQDRINWEAVAEDPDVNFVYIKATEHASLVDKMFQTNVRAAHRVGVPVGCYHFFSPTAAPTAQLKNLTSAVPHLDNHDLVPMIDVEAKGKSSPENLRRNLRQFLKGVESYYGVKPIIYTGMNFYNKYLAGYFEDYMFMIAKYSEGFPELHGNPKFALWQFSASGRVKGIRGDVDCSCFVDGYSLKDILIKRKK